MELEGRRDSFANATFSQSLYPVLLGACSSKEKVTLLIKSY
jgi:hypothetical protein